MNEGTGASDKRVEVVQQRLSDDLVDEHGDPADERHVEAVVSEKAEALTEAPLQEFVPLLVEHQARDELRQQGLHRDFPPDTADVDSDDRDDTRDPQRYASARPAEEAGEAAPG